MKNETDNQTIAEARRFHALFNARLNIALIGGESLKENWHKLIEETKAEVKDAEN